MTSAPAAPSTRRLPERAAVLDLLGLAAWSVKARQDREAATGVEDEYGDPVRFAEEVLGHDLWHVQREILQALTVPRARVAVKSCHASSKALALDTPIPTPSGWTRMGDLEPGAVIYDEAGRPVPVSTVSQVMVKPAYRVTFCTGESVVASGDHLWSAIDHRHRPRRVRDWRLRWDAARPVTTEQMAAALWERDQYRWRIPVAGALAGEGWPLKTEPYVFGAWLGDGTTVRAELTCGEEDLPHFLGAVGGVVRRQFGRAPTLVFGGRLKLDSPVREIGGFKHLPIAVLRSGAAERLAVLRGLMDTDGWHTKGAGVAVSQTNRRLAEGIRELVISLGWRASWREQRAVLDGRDCGPCYVVSFAPDVCPFSLPRKMAAWSPPGRQASRFTQRTVVSVEPVGPTETRCIGVDSPRHLYLAGRAMVPTHNTFLAAEAVLWAPNAGGIAVTTAPTGRQVRRLVWAEVNAMALRTRRPLPGRLLLTEYSVAPDRFALGLATNAGVNFQGFHARPDGFLLIIGDEAPGITQDVYAAIEGVRAGGDVRVLILGNPDIPSGAFFDVFTSQRAGWQTFTISALDSPNFTDEVAAAAGVSRQLTMEEVKHLPHERAEYAERPYLITRGYVREKLEEWGEGNPLFQSKVEGEFPDQAESSLITLRWLTEAKLRDLEPADGETWEWEAGIDVAGPGEAETVLSIRHGPRIVLTQGWARPDPRGEVVEAMGPYKTRLTRIKVDTVGIGYYFARHLEDHGYRGRVVDVNAGATARRREKYVNRRAEMCWAMRERFSEGRVCGADGLLDERAMAQAATLRYGHTASGQVVVESKAEALKRGVRSPDRFEAWMLAFAEAGTAAPPPPEGMAAVSTWAPVGV